MSKQLYDVPIRELPPEERRAYFARKKKEERLKNPQKHKNNSDRYREKHTEEIKERDKKRHRGNPDHIKRASEWKKNNPERARENSRRSAARRRAVAKGLPADLSKTDWENCLKYFNNSCAYCGAKTFLHQDHFIPSVKNGPYTATNIVPSCRPCNYSKNRAFAEDWLTWKFPERKLEILEKIKHYFSTLT